MDGLNVCLDNGTPDPSASFSCGSPGSPNCATATWHAGNNRLQFSIFACGNTFHHLRVQENHYRVTASWDWRSCGDYGTSVSCGGLGATSLDTVTRKLTLHFQNILDGARVDFYVYIPANYPPLLPPSTPPPPPPASPPPAGPPMLPITFVVLQYFTSSAAGSLTATQGCQPHSGTNWPCWPRAAQGGAVFDGSTWDTFVVQCTHKAHMSLGLTETAFTNTQYSDWWTIATGHTAAPAVGFHPYDGGTMNGGANSNYGTSVAGRWYQIKYGSWGGGHTWKEEACTSSGCNTITTHAKSLTFPLRPTVLFRGTSVTTGGGGDSPITASAPHCTAWLERDGSTPPPPVLLGAGYCSDWAYVSGTNFEAPHLPTSHALSVPGDPLLECAYRCISDSQQPGSTTQRLAFYVVTTGTLCACSTGTCSTLQGNNEYHSYSIPPGLQLPSSSGRRLYQLDEQPSTGEARQVEEPQEEHDLFDHVRLPNTGSGHPALPDMSDDHRGPFAGWRPRYGPLLGMDERL